MEGKLCVITGATDGIGRVTARALAERGAEVVLVGRNAAKGAEVCEAIHRSSRKQARAFRAGRTSPARPRSGRWRSASPKAARPSTCWSTTWAASSCVAARAPMGIEMTFALNHLGYFLLTGLLLDSLKGERGRPHRQRRLRGPSQRADGPWRNPQSTRRYKGWRAYAQSKLANILFTYCLAALLEGDAGLGPTACTPASSPAGSARTTAGSSPRF